MVLSSPRHQGTKFTKNTKDIFRPTNVMVCIFDFGGDARLVPAGQGRGELQWRLGMADHGDCKIFRAVALVGDDGCAWLT